MSFNTAGTDNGGRREGGGAHRAWTRVLWRYIASVLAGVLGSLALFFVLLLALRGTGNLPPPAFSNSLCTDEKLVFMREQRLQSPDMLVIGSSVAWRHFDGSAMAGNARGSRPLNGAFCGLRSHQSVYVANWLLDRERTVRQVLMIAAPQDFTGCSQTGEAVFDRGDVDRFVYGGGSRWLPYVDYFSPLSLLRNARHVKDQRANRVELDPLVFDRYAGGPMDTATRRETLHYGAPEPLDPACFKALESLATRLRREGRQLFVVSTPLHPEWTGRHDADGSFRASLADQIRRAIRPAAGTYWDADREWTTDTASFTDAIHLRWSAAQEFSRAIAEHLRAGESAGASSGSVLH